MVSARCVYVYLHVCVHTLVGKLFYFIISSSASMFTLLALIDCCALRTAQVPIVSGEVAEDLANYLVCVACAWRFIHLDPCISRLMMSGFQLRCTVCGN